MTRAAVGVSPVVLTPARLFSVQYLAGSENSRNFLLPASPERRICRLADPTEPAERDRVIVEWTYLSAQPTFVQEYYQKEFGKRGFAIDVVKETQEERQILFKKGDIEGRIDIADTPKSGTDRVLMTIETPAR